MSHTTATVEHSRIFAALNFVANHPCMLAGVVAAHAAQLRAAPFAMRGR
jgi:hypothetical protein